MAHPFLNPKYPKIIMRNQIHIMTFIYFVINKLYELSCVKLFFITFVANPRNMVKSNRIRIVAEKIKKIIEQTKQTSQSKKKSCQNVHAAAGPIMLS